jgi:hypothetical protein
MPCQRASAFRYAANRKPFRKGQKLRQMGHSKKVQSQRADAPCGDLLLPRRKKIPFATMVGHFFVWVWNDLHNDSSHIHFLHNDL